jgi:hypothetical protein
MTCSAADKPQAADRNHSARRHSEPSDSLQMDRRRDTALLALAGHSTPGRRSHCCTSLAYTGSTDIPSSNRGKPLPKPSATRYVSSQDLAPAGRPPPRSTLAAELERDKLELKKIQPAGSARRVWVRFTDARIHVARIGYPAFFVGPADAVRSCDRRYSRPFSNCRSVNTGFSFTATSRRAMISWSRSRSNRSLDSLRSSFNS